MRDVQNLEDTKQMAPVPAHPGRGRRILLTVFLAGIVGALAAAAVFSAGDGDARAQLRIRQDSVEIQHDNSDFARAREGQGIEGSDVVRTDSTGRAQIDFFDGSLVRLDVFSEVAVRRLSDAKGARIISLGVNAGRVWNRVTSSTSEGGRYEVHFQNAVAWVEGTTFVVDCSRDLHCYVLGVDETTKVRTDADEQTAGKGQCVDLVGEQLEPCDANALGLIDEWFRFNLAEDQQLQIAATATATPSPTPTASPTRRPRSFVRPVVTTPPRTAVPTAAPTPTTEPTPKKTPKKSPTPSPSIPAEDPTGPPP